MKTHKKTFKIKTLPNVDGVAVYFKNDLDKTVSAFSMDYQKIDINHI